MAEFYMKDIRAWRDATLMLSFEERGYFDELLSLIYIYDDCLPDDDDLICRAMPVSKRLHKRLKNKLLKARVIEIKEGFYSNKRSTIELLKINSKSTINKENASKRWAKSRKKNNKYDADALQTDMPIVKVNSERESIPNGIPRAGNYKFEGNVVKLNFDDYTRWKKSYHAIPDFEAQLQAADDWISGEEEKDKKRWFQVISSMLGKKHQNFLSEEKKEKLNGSSKPRGLM